MRLITDAPRRPDRKPDVTSEPWMEVRIPRVAHAYATYERELRTRQFEIGQAAEERLRDQYKINPTTMARVMQVDLFMRNYDRELADAQALVKATQDETGTIRLPLREVGFIVQVEEGTAMARWFR